MRLKSWDKIERRRTIGALPLAIASMSVLVLLSACRPDPEPEIVPLATEAAGELAEARLPIPTPTPAPTPTPTPTPVDPYAIPDDAGDIDAAYVQRVIDAIAVVQGEAFRRFAAEGEVIPEVEEITGHVYAFDGYEVMLQIYQNMLQRRPDLSNLYEEPGNPRVVLADLIYQGRDCTFIEVREDVSDVLVASMGPSTRRQFYALSPYNDPTQPGNPNPTPWKYSLTFAYEADAEDPENPCEGDD